MGVIKSEKIETAEGSVVLVSVTDGAGIIGTCSAGHIPMNSDEASVTRLFYMGNDPVVRLVCPDHGSRRSDKLASLCPGFEGSDIKLREALTESFDKLTRGESLEAGLHDLFPLLQDGVYAVYTSDYYPTDGNGTFFWGAYNISHEVRGTAERNRVIGKDRTYKPCFLIPSEPPGHYASKTKATTDEAVKTRRCQGIAFHLTGMFSVLLKGHHGSVSCVEKGIPFKCAVIEKITEPYTDPPLPQAQGDSEQPALVREGITGFRSPSVKVPLELFPWEMLLNILGGRAEYKPEHFNVLLKKLNTVRKKSVTNNVIPRNVLEKSERMPDIEMMESTCAISGLSDEQLNALLAGDTEYDGSVIISPNLYSSMITACSYLQFTDKNRFIDFAIKAMSRPELGATHEYIARRASAVANSAKLYKFFKDAVGSGDIRFEKITAAANRYIADYEAANN